MRVMIDNQLAATGPCSNVRQAIAAVAAKARDQDRLIVEVTVDGTIWNHEKLESDAANADAKEINVLTADPGELVCQTFADAADALASAEALQSSAATLIQAGQLIKALPQLNEALGIWLSVQQALTMGAAVANLDLTTIEQTIDQLNQKLRSLRDSLRIQDNAALADALMYDFPQVVLEWRGMLQDLQTEIRAVGSGSRRSK